VKIFPTVAIIVFFNFAVNQAAAQSLSNCISSDSDIDGDGYGWEDGQSCTVVTDQPGQSVEQLNYCYVVSPSDNDLPYCSNIDQVSDPLPDLVDCEDPDGDGWGWNDLIINRLPGIGTCQALPNLVRNGSFDNGSEGWNTYLHPDSVYGTDSLAPFASNFTFLASSVPWSSTPITKASFEWRRAGTQWWHSQLFTDPISLEGGRTYRLSFTAGENFTRTGGAVGSVVVENGTDFTGLSIDSVRLVALNTGADQQVVASNCDYTNASLYGGWGWDAVARESCAPQGSMAVQPNQSQCIDPDGDGWGWDGVASCIP